MSFSACSAGVFAPTGVLPPSDGSGVPGFVLGLNVPAPSPGTGVVKPDGGAAAFGPSGDAGTISRGRSGILMRFASLL